MKVVCFHLFNDFSGSPRMLRLVIKGFLQEGYDVDVVTSRDGLLDNKPYVTGESEEGDRQPHFHYYNYRFSQKSLLTMVRYLWAQIYTFFFALRYFAQKDTIFYINTILPVAPAIAGRLMGKKVVYHYHENSFAKGVVYKVLCRIMQYVATDIICVSKFQQKYLVKKEKTRIVPNVLSDNFKKRLRPDAEKAYQRQTVMMVSSLKAYKGVGEFIELAKRLPQFHFVLVLNETEVSMLTLTNLKIYPRQTDIVPFYNDKASVVINLSDKNKFIETFGLTALESMAAGLPVIVPTVGGIAEMVDDGKNGYLTDVQDIDMIEKELTMLLTDKNLYMRMSEQALKKAEQYNYADFRKEIINVIQNSGCLKLDT